MNHGHAENCELAAGTGFLRRWDDKKIAAERLRGEIENEIARRSGTR